MTATQPIRAVIEEALATGPYPGKWITPLSVFDNDGVPESVIQSEDVSATIAVTLEFGPNNPRMREANAAYIAAVNPTAIRQLLADHDAQVKALSDELVRVRGALTQIADKQMRSLDGLSDFGVSWERSLFIGSLKEIARAALSPTTPID